MRVLTAYGRYKMAEEAIEKEIDLANTSLASKARATSCE